MNSNNKTKSLINPVKTYKKGKTTYMEVECKSALNKIKNPKYHFSHTLNIYRGCIHKCPYCYARYTHWYLGYDEIDDFMNTVFIKTNVNTLLEKELSKASWKNHLVDMGTACDSYQPIERKYKLSRKALKLFAKYRTPVVFSTKSPIVTRDVDVLKELNERAFGMVAVTLTTTDESIRKIMEPHASSVNHRINTIKTLKENGIKTGIHILPIMKYINDSEESLSKIIKVAKHYEIDYLIYGGLNISSYQIRKSILNALNKYDKKLYFRYNNEFRNRSYSDKYYYEQIYNMIKKLIQKYSLNLTNPQDLIRNGYMRMNKYADKQTDIMEKEDLQLSLF